MSAKECAVAPRPPITDRRLRAPAGQRDRANGRCTLKAAVEAALGRTAAVGRLRKVSGRPEYEFAKFQARTTCLNRCTSVRRCRKMSHQYSKGPRQERLSKVSISRLVQFGPTTSIALP